MRRHLKQIGAVVGVAVSVGVAILIRVMVGGDNHDHGSAAVLTYGSGQVATSVGSTTAIDKGIGETFSPPSEAADGTQPALSPDQAWHRFAAQNGATDDVVPPNLTVMLGALTYPTDNVGPASTWTYRARNELSYGYRSGTQTCASTTSAVTTAPATYSCVRWVFLNAQTGELIDMTSQRLSPASAGG
jgi:hypothetical protein